MIKKIAHVCIGTLDLPATERFYCSGLGLAKAFNFTRNGEVVGFYLQLAEGSYIEVFRKDAVVQQPDAPLRHFCIEVDDMDGVLSRLKAHGYNPSEKKIGRDQSWQAWMTDPSGVAVEFHQYTARSSQVTRADCVLP